MSNVHYPDPPPVFSLNQLRLQNKPFNVSLTNNPYHKIVSNKNTLFINNSKDNYCPNKEYN